MKYLSLSGYVISRRNFGEADRIITFFTKERGKYQLKARGVRLAKSKLAGNLEPFGLVKIRAVEGRGLDTLIGAQATELFSLEAVGLDAMATGLLMCELLYNLCPLAQSHPEVYQLIGECLHGLSNGAPHQVVAHYFTFLLLVELGYIPELPDEISQQPYLDLEHGVFSDRRSNVAQIKLSSTTIKLWKLCLIANLVDVMRVTQIESISRSAQSSLDAFFTHRFDIELKTKKLL